MDEVTITNFKRCDLVKMSGRVDSLTAPKLEEVLKSLIDSERYKIIFDMSEVNFMSSKGWWVLIETQKACKRYRRGELKLTNVQPAIRDSLNLVGMGSYFQIFDDATAAVGSF